MISFLSLLTLLLTPAWSLPDPEAPLFVPAAAETQPSQALSPSEAVFLEQAPSTSEEAEEERTVPGPSPLQGEPVRGIHVTGWAAGSPKFRKRVIRQLQSAGLNAIVIALKEYDGKVFIKGGPPLVREIGAHTGAISDARACVEEFREAGIRTIGRVVLFKDEILANKRPEWAVKTPGGGIWRTKKGVAWVDPYRKEVQDYNLAIAAAAARAGFDEIQFDYIRFPSDGDTKLCRYSEKDHSPETAGRAIRGFLRRARSQLEPMGAEVSICLFGMTTSAAHDMGIGQRITSLAREADYISPMMYPSHYNRGELGVDHPNREPYKIIKRGLKDAVQRLGPQAHKLRPYFQDFSLGVRYDADKVRAQILAAESVGVRSWILWNPQNRYKWKAFRHNRRSILTPPTESEASVDMSSGTKSRSSVDYR